MRLSNPLPRFRVLFKYGWVLKTMATLGPEALGPKCATCGMPDVRAMAPQLREALEAIIEKKVEEYEFICRCPPGTRTKIGTRSVWSA